MTDKVSDDDLRGIVHDYPETLAAIAAELLTLRRREREARECVWTYSGDEYEDQWSTGCGRAFCMIEGSPKDNDYDFCPGCGCKLRQVYPKDVSEGVEHE